MYGNQENMLTSSNGRSALLAWQVRLWPFVFFGPPPRPSPSNLNGSLATAFLHGFSHTFTIL